MCVNDVNRINVYNFKNNDCILCILDFIVIKRGASG